MTITRHVVLLLLLSMVFHEVAQRLPQATVSRITFTT